jgi:hypothetical protein
MFAPVIKIEMKNLHLLPTDKPSRLFKDYNDVLHLNSHHVIKGIFTRWTGSNQNIYITSDEEIKEDDWGLSKLNEVILFGRSYNEKFYKKIILTTDQDLIADGVQAIDDEFLEWFVKNPSCESVEVMKEYKDGYGNWYNYQDDFKFTGLSIRYKIIIPKEELERGITITHVGKQETLEEAAEKLYSEDIMWGMDLNKDTKNAFIDGAKWQQERMYSEEDLHKAYCAGSDFDMSCLKGEQYYMFKEWFEQFKKK